jgi:four helix bundle protein
MRLVENIYRIIQMLPKNENFGLSDQMRRCATSIPSNIAEGYRRMSRKDYMRFIRIAFGSASELETQIEIVQRLNFVSPSELIQAHGLVIEVQKMLNRLSSRLDSSS